MTDLKPMSIFEILQESVDAAAEHIQQASVAAERAGRKAA